MSLPNDPADACAWERHPVEEFSRIAADWDRIVTEAGYPPFLDSRFLKHLVDVFGCRRGQFLVGRRDARPVAAGLFVRDGLGRWVSYQPSQLPLGAWIALPGESWTGLMRSICSTLPGAALAIGLTQLDPRLNPRPEDNDRLETLDYVATAWVELDRTFEEYWEARGKNLRQNLRKSRRKIDDMGGRLSLTVVESPEAVDAAFLDFAAIESVGWKASSGTAISATNDQGRFYRGLLAEFAARGQGFAICLSLDGQPIALDFGIRDASTIVLLKTTYDENHKALSPAQLLHEQAFEYFFKYWAPARVEFYGKVMEWHTRWAEDSRMLFHVNVYRSPSVRRVARLVKSLRARTVAATALADSSG